MKSILRSLFAGVFIPIAVATTFYQATLSLNKADVPQTVARPYIIEIIGVDGQKIDEISGKSNSSDPFVIAKYFGANPNIEDKFTAFPDIKMQIGSKITIYRAPVYEILDGKKKKEIRSWKKDVGELLDEQKIELGLDDKINFGIDTELENGMSIKITRVAKTTIKETQPINYNTIKKDDPTMNKGLTKVSQAGKKGTKNLYYDVVREDGEEVSRKLSKTEVAVAPVDEILLVGTKPVITTACRFDDIVIEASLKYGIDPNQLCFRMMKESRGNANSDGGDYKGLFQYEEGFWQSASSKAGYGGASIWDAKAQIYTTAWAWSHGLRSRWPAP